MLGVFTSLAMRKSDDIVHRSLHLIGFGDPHKGINILSLNADIAQRLVYSLAKAEM